MAILWSFLTQSSLFATDQQHYLFNSPLLCCSSPDISLPLWMENLNPDFERPAEVRDILSKVPDVALTNKIYCTPLRSYGLAFS